MTISFSEVAVRQLIFGLDIARPYATLTGARPDGCASGAAAG